jgi:hypothetical protein
MNDSEINTPEKQQKSAKYKFGKITLPIILIIPIAFVAYRYFSAPPAGFCVAQNRFLTDDEYINRSTNSGKPCCSGQKVVDGKPSILGCCQVNRVDSGFWSKLFWNDAGVEVSWWYERSQVDFNEHGNPTAKYMDVTHAYDSCATNLLHNWTMRVSTPSGSGY